MGVGFRRPSMLALGVWTGAFSACARLGLEGPIRPPRFSEAEGRSSELAILPPSAGRPAGTASIRLWARVENPNSFSLTITELSGDLFLGEAEVDVDLPLGLPLVAGADTVIAIDIAVGLNEVPRLAETAAAALVTRRLDYRLDAILGIEAGMLGRPRFGPLTLLEGELEVHR